MAGQDMQQVVGFRSGMAADLNSKKRSSMPDISDLIRAVKARDPTEHLPAKTKSRMFGSLTVHDIALNK